MLPISHVLTINGGSSSIKFALFESGEPPRRVLSGSVDRIGSPNSILKIQKHSEPAESISVPEMKPPQALELLLDRLEAIFPLHSLSGIGHRIVHGGPDHLEPQRIGAELLADLKAVVPLDPDHLPSEIALIESLRQRLPEIPQIACFDTAFHRHMPLVAKLLPIPRKYLDRGIHRYGFHGLSFTYLMEALSQHGAESQGKVLLAHLGSGCSLAAVHRGQSLDTTMGFTPTGGLMMGTRTGDLDPGILIHLARAENLSPRDLDRLVNKESGLLGVSGASSDLRDLLSRQEHELGAAEAVELFCYTIRKEIGAYAAVLDGLETLVFAGGIGEHSPEARRRICEGLKYLGVELDAVENAKNAAVISTEKSSVIVRVIPTDEESVIAKIAFKLIAENR
ncbi:acetate/propionate family kinase [Telmatocola sphagniphila]|uniref:Acetate kinase n=1 Tax=Telmatocola sphagniphila TaxID=1123043 RepID=A0A8E6F0V0_9BACT|nr:acetate/propionate family kinase [Telmatocola sphagniphila]